MALDVPWNKRSPFSIDTSQVIEAHAMLAEVSLALGEMGNASASIAKATALLNSLSDQAMTDECLCLKAIQLKICIYNKDPHSIRQQLQVCETAVQQSRYMESRSIRQVLCADHSAAARQALLCHRISVGYLKGTAQR